MSAQIASPWEAFSSRSRDTLRLIGAEYQSVHPSHRAFCLLCIGQYRTYSEGVYEGRVYGLTHTEERSHYPVESTPLARDSVCSPRRYSDSLGKNRGPGSKSGLSQSELTNMTAADPVLFLVCLQWRITVSLCSLGCPATLCRPGSPQTQRSICFCVPSGGIKGVYCHTPLPFCY